MLLSIVLALLLTEICEHPFTPLSHMSFQVVAVYCLPEVWSPYSIELALGLLALFHKLSCRSIRVE